MYIQGTGTIRRKVLKEKASMKVDTGILTETKRRSNEMVNDYIHFYSRVDKNKRAKREVSMIVYNKYMRNIKNSHEYFEKIMTLELTRNNGEVDTNSCESKKKFCYWRR